MKEEADSPNIISSVNTCVSGATWFIGWRLMISVKVPPQEFLCNFDDQVEWQSAKVEVALNT